MSSDMLHWLDIKNDNICIDDKGLNMKLIDCGLHLISFRNPENRMRIHIIDLLNRDMYKVNTTCKLLVKLLMYLQYAFSNKTNVNKTKGLTHFCRKMASEIIKKNSHFMTILEEEMKHYKRPNCFMFFIRHYMTDTSNTDKYYLDMFLHPNKAVLFSK